MQVFSLYTSCFLLLIITYIASCAGVVKTVRTRNSNGPFTQLAVLKEKVEEIIYNQDRFPIIPEKFLACKKNHDCVLAEDNCGTIAVHRSYKKKYDLWRKKAFSGYIFDCMNDLSYYEPQCVDFKCKAVKVETDM